MDSKSIVQEPKESGNGDTGYPLLTSLEPKIDLVVDLQYGSTGKGLFCGYLSNERDYDTVITANMPNSGHTYVSKDGTKYMFKVLPSSAVGKTVKTVLIGPGAVFSLDQLAIEIDYLRKDQVLRIHPNAMVLMQKHWAEERKRLSHISSTSQGAAAAVIDKMWRSNKPPAPTAKVILKNSKFSKYLCSHDEWRVRLSYTNRALAEGSQGYSLGINTQFYPYTTSRDCTPAAFLSAMGIPIGMLDNIYGVCRTLPIRVGGPSGDMYADQEELSWDKLGITPELTTVTKRERRIFTYSKMQIEEAIWACNPDMVFVNFANYIAKDYMENIVAHIDMMSHVRWVGFGPTHDDIGVI